jgi:hypothetical protein
VVRYFPAPSDSAFSTLVATGRLGIISDHSLINELQLYRSQWRNLDTSQNLTLRPFREQAINTGQKYGLSPFGSVAEDVYLDLLRENADLRGAMRTHLEYVVIHRNLLSETLKLNEVLLDSVRGDVK